MIINVSINISTHTCFSYHVPKILKQQIAIGKRILVPLGKRKVTGYVIDIIDSTEIHDLKDIIMVLDDEPLFNNEDLSFYRWISDYYMYPLGNTLKAILPSGLNIESSILLTAVNSCNGDHKKLTPTQQIILETLKQHPRGLSLKSLQKTCRKTRLSEALINLKERGCITTTETITKAPVQTKEETYVQLLSFSPSETLKISKKQQHILDFLKHREPVTLSNIRHSFQNVYSTIASLKQKGLIDTYRKEVYRTPQDIPFIGNKQKTVTLNAEQESALASIIQGLSASKYSPFLLHGVTGSGKTEVYLKAIEKALSMQGSVLFLVPEIALTPQTISRIKERFSKNHIAILHSGIGKSIKYDEWRRIQRGQARIIVGVRSAIFAPIRNLRLIIVDEEHDVSYKQDDRFRYNARDLAIVKARQQSAVIVLGSATPDIQTFFNTQTKNFSCLTLSKRIENKQLPKVEIIDMKQSFDKSGAFSVFSEPLKKMIQKTLDDKKQTLLFLNRRGFHTFILCTDCGHIFKCASCSVSLTYHKDESILKCHYCGYTLRAFPICPSCGSTKIRSYGLGTEKLTEEIKTLFPKARTERLDSDAIGKKGNIIHTLHKFNRGEIDILIGTQIITKGHDFPNISLVGVISADTALNMPDFRASERTFQQLTQVSGRGGRGNAPGTVIIQTVNPNHYAIRWAQKHDYLGFYQEELAIRQDLYYAPFSRMINLHLSSPKEETVRNGAKQLGLIARNHKKHLNGIEILGPAEAPISKINGKYRWQLLFKGNNVRNLHCFVRNVLTESSGIGAEIKIDVDPIQFM